MLLTTPDEIRTLQTTCMDAGDRATQEQLPRKLYTKAKQEPAYRFYARVTRCGGQTSSCLPTALFVPIKEAPELMG